MSKLSLIGRSLPVRILKGKLSGGPGSKLSGSRKFTPFLGVATVMILMIIMWAPTVQAAETRTVDGWIRIDPDIGSMTVNASWNMSDPDTSDMFNWNQTVDPFEQANNLTGSFTGTWLPPIDFLVEEDRTKLTVCGLVKFKSTWIMSGSTESWWRIPIDGPGWGDSANITIWHIDSPATLNVTATGTPNEISHPSKVFDQDFEMDVASLGQTVRYWNGTAWDRGFNSTWVRVAAQIHTDEFYLVRWVIYNVDDPYRIRFSATDQCEDRVSRSWMIYYDSTREVYEADLDFSVLHIHGMGYSVWGHEIVANETINPKITWYTELDHKIQNGEYLTVMIPFLDIVNNSTNVRIGFGTQNDSWSTFWWVAENGPTDFGLKSVQWDVAWGSKDMKIEMTIYNLSRSLWIMDSNPEFDPDWTWDLNRYTVDDHDWAPNDYYFGGTPYHSCQITNGSWQNTHPTGTYYMDGREVLDPYQLMKKRQDGDNWFIEIWLVGYEQAGRVTAAFSYAMAGDFDKAWDALDPQAPFPLDAPWYIGKYYFKGLGFLTDLGNQIWVGLVWLYEAGQWIADNASWIFAGVLTLMVLLIVPPIWKRFFQLNWGLIRFGWILARDGVIAASDYADEFWKEFVATSYLKKVAMAVPVSRVAKGLRPGRAGKFTKKTIIRPIKKKR